MNDIFVSYRRSDSSAIVGRVIDRLETHFGKQHIFRDLDSIAYGEHFGQEITKALSGCKVCLVIIGDDWVDVRDKAGKRRIDNPKDWVRTEVANALEQDVHVIPVLVENAPMPDASQLPDNLKDLTSRNAAKVRDDPDFNVDMERLCKAIEKRLGRGAAPVRKLFAQPRNMLVAAVILSVLVLAAIFQSDLRMMLGSPGTPDAITHQLRIEGVELFPPANSAVVKVTAFVNGTQFTYPSIGGVEWLQVAPSMSGQTFRLPNAEQYEIRFEMLKKQPGMTEAARFLSQETISFDAGSVEGRYALFGFDPASSTRSGQTSAEIIYSIH